MMQLMKILFFIANFTSALFLPSFYAYGLKMNKRFSNLRSIDRLILLKINFNELDVFTSQKAKEKLLFEWKSRA